MTSDDLDESGFEGTLVLEQLAGIGRLEEFYAAVDSDDFDVAKNLTGLAEIDTQTIATVLQKMADAE